jgi:hypothetical protein
MMAREFVSDGRARDLLAHCPVCNNKYHRHTDDRLREFFATAGAGRCGSLRDIARSVGLDIDKAEDRAALDRHVDMHVRCR